MLRYKNLWDYFLFSILFLSQKVDKEPIYEQSKVIFTHLHGHKAIAAISLNLL